jgi:hypothetical protein
VVTERRKDWKAKRVLPRISTATGGTMPGIDISDGIGVPGDGRSRIRRADETLQMILPDVNGLICAFRRDMPHHATCRQWLHDVVTSDARFGMSPLALAALVRVTTNPRAYRTPDSIADHCDRVGAFACRGVSR